MERPHADQSVQSPLPEPGVVPLLLRALATAHTPAKWLVAFVTVLLLLATTRDMPAPYPGWLFEPIERGTAYREWTPHPAEAAWGWLERAARPYWWAIVPWLRLFAPHDSWSSFGTSLWVVLASTLITLLAGGILACLTAPALALRDRPTLIASVRWTAQRFPTLLGAALAPLIGAGVFAALCFLVGLLCRAAGGVATWPGGAVFVLGVLVAIPLTWLLVGWLAAWPLMVHAVAAHGSDVLDALSRGYGYFMRRKALLLLLVGVAWLMLAAGMALVNVALDLLLFVATWAMGLAGNDFNRVRGAWILVERTLLAAWSISAFWSLVGAIFLILRRNVDGTSTYHYSTI